MEISVTFDRIGRRHDVPDLITDMDTRHLGVAVNVLTKAIHGYAKTRCASRTIEVIVDLDENGHGEGTIYAGMHTAGSFTVAPVKSSEGEL